MFEEADGREPRQRGPLESRRRYVTRALVAAVITAFLVSVVAFIWGDLASYMECKRQAAMYNPGTIIFIC